ncbi:MAG: 1-deoxy-D-xylulose-5-phosphate synthase [Clostridia bacterium]|nr:1-deoxy-D-xylulose-5-phosphate synthase [Clostridia bacterium]
MKKLDKAATLALCEEIRDCIISTVSQNGGHLASNLGAVELTVAIHQSFSSPQDSVLFDVGHQCYTHKLLTGRFDRFSTIRTENGLSGYMRPDESEHDPMITGHSSSSISAAYGIAKAKELCGEEGYVVVVVGDGAMTGGMVYEAMNNAGSSKLKNNLIVVLNDNKMSISGNVGALARYLSAIRSKPGYHRFKNRVERFLLRIPFIGKWLRRNIFRSKTMLKNAIYHSNIFEALGFNYMGPVDGHDIEKLNSLFQVAKEEDRPVIIHAMTTKGKGYNYAEDSPTDYHGVSPFNVEKGSEQTSKKNFSSVCGDILCDMAKEDEKICAVTAAMREGTGLVEFAQQYPKRFFDVGIAEQHAVAFCGGLASKGLKPVFCVYSSFLQRGYDQIIHDVAIAGWPVTFCIDRAGIVGDDGETHQGLFDVSFLTAIPGLEIYSPANYADMEIALRKAIESAAPSAVRYPRGGQCEIEGYIASDSDYTVMGEGDIAIVTYGITSGDAAVAAKELSESGMGRKDER